ncbi:MAG: glycosyl transferase, group 2 family protein, partial [Acidimicrobiales bacterium]|nr:glycosyl transferase, group 2 family protein [Acidimicrobiales bacterium]
MALDDGSTDETGSVLRSYAIVQRLLTNGRRETSFGWNDGANRNRLLAEAADLRPEWILSIDADERVDATDAEALRRFLATEALAGLAYGFRLFRMVDDDRYDPDVQVVHRLFRYQPGQRFPDAQLWCTPIPTSVPGAARVETSLRIQHLGDAGLLGWQRRLARHAEADPRSQFRRPLPPADSAPARLLPWGPRPADLEVLGAPRTAPEAAVSGRP